MSPLKRAARAELKKLLKPERKTLADALNELSPESLEKVEFEKHAAVGAVFTFANRASFTPLEYVQYFDEVIARLQTEREVLADDARNADDLGDDA